MSRDIVTAAARAALSQLTATWQARSRTSTGAAAQPTFGAWGDVAAHETQRTWDREFSDDMQTELRIERSTVRVSDAETTLVAGDQMKDPSGVIFAVERIISSAPGSRRYELRRDMPLVSMGNRGGSP